MVREIPELTTVLQRIAEIKARFGPVSNVGAGGFASALAAAQAPPHPARIDPALEQTIAQSAAQHDLEPALIKAVMQAESGFNPLAVSRAGAQGLMQLMPSTAGSLGVQNPFDPAENVPAGSRYLRQLLDAYNGDISLALAAYNAGSGAVRRYGGIPPYPETQRYVTNVLGLLERYRAAEAAGR